MFIEKWLYQFPKPGLQNPVPSKPLAQLGRGVWDVNAKRLLFKWATVAAKPRIDIIFF